MTDIVCLCMCVCTYMRVCAHTSTLHVYCEVLDRLMRIVLWLDVYWYDSIWSACFCMDQYLCLCGCVMCSLCLPGLFEYEWTSWTPSLYLYVMYVHMYDWHCMFVYVCLYVYEGMRAHFNTACVLWGTGQADAYRFMIRRVLIRFDMISLFLYGSVSMCVDTCCVPWKCLPGLFEYEWTSWMPCSHVCVNVYVCMCKCVNV